MTTLLSVCVKSEGKTFPSSVHCCHENPCVALCQSFCYKAAGKKTGKNPDAATLVPKTQTKIFHIENPNQEQKQNARNKNVTASQRKRPTQRV